MFNVIGFLKGIKKDIKTSEIENNVKKEVIALTKEEIIDKTLSIMKIKLDLMELKHDLDNSKWHELCEKIYGLCIKYNLSQDFQQILDGFLSTSRTRISFGNKSANILFSDVICHLEILCNYGISVDDIINLRNEFNDRTFSKTKEFSIR